MLGSNQDLHCVYSLGFDGRLKWKRCESGGKDTEQQVIQVASWWRLVTFCGIQGPRETECEDLEKVQPACVKRRNKCVTWPVCAKSINKDRNPGECITTVHRRASQNSGGCLSITGPEAYICFRKLAQPRSLNSFLVQGLRFCCPQPRVTFPGHFKYNLCCHP